MAELREFVDRDGRRVAGALMLMTGGDRGAVEDALQSALLKAWERGQEPIDRLAAWVTVVAANLLRSEHRRRGSEERALVRLGGQASAALASEGSLDERLVAALRALPAREREVAVMHYVLDVSQAVIADELNITVGSVKTLLSRARQHLAVALGANGEGLS